MAFTALIYSMEYVIIIMSGERSKGSLVERPEAKPTLTRERRSERLERPGMLGNLLPRQMEASPKSPGTATSGKRAV